MWIVNRAAYNKSFSPYCGNSKDSHGQILCLYRDLEIERDFLAGSLNHQQPETYPKEAISGMIKNSEFMFSL